VKTDSKDTPTPSSQARCIVRFDSFLTRFCSLRRFAIVDCPLCSTSVIWFDIQKHVHLGSLLNFRVIGCVAVFQNATHPREKRFFIKMRLGAR
jgi:hypothetical protein